ncbi:MAG TPA: hypothetical protein VM537_16305 [Anaerolineae bacterium]|nr:hypothetical protein [Anaerolineae bacterium]
MDWWADSHTDEEATRNGDCSDRRPDKVNIDAHTAWPDGYSALNNAPASHLHSHETGAYTGTASRDALHPSRRILHGKFTG